MLQDHIHVFEKHNAPGAYSKHVPGAVCISKYGPGAYLTKKRLLMVQDHLVLEHIILDRKLKQNSQKTFSNPCTEPEQSLFPPYQNSITSYPPFVHTI